MKEVRAFLRRQLADAFQIKSNRLIEGVVDLGEGTSLNGNVEVEANRLPLVITAFGVTMKQSAHDRGISHSGK